MINMNNMINAIIPANPARPAPTTHGLTLLELMLALSITTIVAAAIAGMLSAVTVGVGTRRDARSVMIRAGAAQSRLSAYIIPCSSLLANDGSSLVVWLEDSRASDTVHATEVRWLSYDAADGAIDVHFVDFPETWTPAARDLADTEYTADADWNAVLWSYQINGWISTLRLVDGLDSVAVTTDSTDILESRRVDYALGFQTTRAPVPVRLSATIRAHERPAS